MPEVGKDWVPLNSEGGGKEKGRRRGREGEEGGGGEGGKGGGKS